MTTQLLDGIARHLAALDLVAYDPTGAAQPDDWSLFIDHLPDDPDLAVSISTYPGGDVDPLLVWQDTPVQVRTRGSADPRVSRDKCDELLGQLVGLGPVALPNGVWLQLAVARSGNSGPAALGPDPSGRHEHICNLLITWSNPTAHRPGP